MLGCAIEFNMFKICDVRCQDNLSYKISLNWNNYGRLNHRFNHHKGK